MRRLLVLARSFLLINLRNRTTLFWNFAFPLGLMALYGLIMGEGQADRPTMIAWLAVGIVVLNLMSSGFVGDAAWLTNMRDQGVL